LTGVDRFGYKSRRSLAIVSVLALAAADHTWPPL
jgi:hypothetical protein